MLCFPNCKINLGLYVTRRRDDGYHDIETVFYPVNIWDVLEVIPAKSQGQANLSLSGIPVVGNKTDNLVWKAYLMLDEAYPGKIPPPEIYLHKVIPMGAGMGGGSADGAFMLRLLNDYASLGLSMQQLAGYALQLGSDCPFFINNKPQFATGRGEQLSDLPINLAGYSIQVVCPDVHVSTRKAFQKIIPRPATFDLRNLHRIPIGQWAYCISNDFEAPVFHLYPLLAEIKQQLLSQGAVYAAMSGSGSSIFGIFPKSQKANIDLDYRVKIFYLD